MLAEVTLAKIFGKAVVDASDNPLSLSKLAVLFDNNVDIRIVVNTSVVFGFDIAVVFSTIGKVEDTTVVRILAVTLANTVVEV